MKRATRTLLLSLLGLAPAALANESAQSFDVDAALEAALAVSRTSVMYDAPAADEIDARGATWKAHFTPNGATYVPFLGADAPRNFPVTFRLVSATLGGVELPLVDRPTVTREGDRVVLDHGAVLEVYDLEPTSIEQSFILPRRTRRGELEIQMDVESDLAAASAGRALRFEGAFGAVRYGEAFALDTVGRRADVRSEYRDGRIALTVPDAFPIEGEDRLVVDPVISTDAPISDLIAAKNPDVAFEKDVASDGTYIIVYETGFSSADRDIYAVEVRAHDNAVVNAGAIEMSSLDTSAPAVAVMDAIDCFLVVYESEVDGSNERQIYGRTRSAGSSDAAPARLITDEIPGTRNLRPDVGGQSGDQALAWCVVWQSVNGSVIQIRARAVFAAGGPLGISRSISAPGSANDLDPVISEGSSAPYGDDRFAFAYSRIQGGNIGAVFSGELRVGINGVEVAQPAFQLGELGNFSRPSVSSVTPVLSSDGDPIYAVAVESEGAPQEDTIIAFLCAGGSIRSVNNVTRMEDIRPREDNRSPAIAWAGDAFTVAYSSAERVYMASASITEVGTREFLALGERAQKMRSIEAVGPDSAPVIVSRFESGETSSREALVAYRSIPIDPNGRTVHIARIESLGQPAIGRQYCSAVENSVGGNGWLALYGTQSSHAYKTAVASGLSESGIVLLLNSLESGFVAEPGGSSGNLCLGGTVGRMLDVVAPIAPDRTATIQFDPRALARPNGTVAAQPGETWHFQAWYRDNENGVATSNFTNAVKFEVQ
ncbi:MAG: hypothetical protein AAGA20_02210 [Planctomycetota bacterium]